MKKLIYVTAIILTFTFAVNGQEIPIPKNYTVINNVSGDLDNDGINELVVAYNTKTRENFESVPRELIIYKLNNGKWSVWKKSKQALYGSDDGGMAGDPLEKIEIQNGILIVSHLGGGRWKWSFTDKYRFQNGEFYLIGYSSLNGMPCEKWEKVDFNLSTGKMIVKLEYKKCETDDEETYKSENETVLKKGLNITFESRHKKEIEIKTPKYGRIISLSIGIE